MKLKSAMLGVALLAFSAGAAHAQGAWWVGGNAGLGVPTGDYGDAAATGWNMGLVATNMVNDRWGFGGDLGYHSWNGSDDLNAVTEALWGPGSEFSWSAIQVTGHTMYRFPSNGNVKPYAKVGLGLYDVTGTLKTPTSDDHTSKNKLGFNFGGGMHVMSHGNSMWGVSGAYHVIPAKDDFGADVSAFSFGVDMMWGVGSR